MSDTKGGKELSEENLSLDLIFQKRKSLINKTKEKNMF